MRKQASRLPLYEAGRWNSLVINTRQHPYDLQVEPCAQLQTTLLPKLHLVRPYLPGDGIMSAELSPTHPHAESNFMTPSYRVLRRLLAIVPAVALFLLISANPLAQSDKLPAPTSHVSDFAGVIDSETKSRLEGLLERLKEKSKIDLYVAVVDNTGAQDVSVFSQQLARQWNIGAKTARGKSLLLVISAASKTSFTQFSRTAQMDLPDGVLGEMSYRMQGPLTDGRIAEAVDSGVHVFVNALAAKNGFNAADLEVSAVAVSSPAEVTSDSPQPVLVSANNSRATRARTVKEN